MRKLIGDLLDLTHIESGQRQRQLAALDLTEAARAARETLSADAASRQVTIEIHPAESISMIADRGEIEMIFNNLISNAIKYNRPGGRVDVRLARQDGRATIEVTDTGIGLSAEEARRLFGEFVRIHNERTQNILGSGLGLSIVKKLATLYGGQVSVESQAGAGSTFRVVLHEPAAGS